MTHLEAWQKSQNGHLLRIDSRLNRYQWFLIGIFATSAGSLAMLVLGILLKRI